MGRMFCWDKIETAKIIDPERCSFCRKVVMGDMLRMREAIALQMGDTIGILCADCCETAWTFWNSNRPKEEEAEDMLKYADEILGADPE